MARRSMLSFVHVMGLHARDVKSSTWHINVGKEKHGMPWLEFSHLSIWKSLGRNIQPLKVEDQQVKITASRGNVVSPVATLT